MDIRDTIPGPALLAVFIPILFAAGQDPNQSRPTIRAEVNMVSISVTVTDSNRRPVTDLRARDFLVFEDGVEQRIAAFAAADEPVSVVLALDTSGSVAVRMGRIQFEAARFLTSLHPDDAVAVLSFGGNVSLLEDFTRDTAASVGGVKRTSAGGLTVLYDAVWFALTDLLGPVEGRKALVLFSDGVDSQSLKASDRQTLDLANSTFAPIYCIYFNTERDWPSGKGHPINPGPIPPSPPSRREEYVRGRRYLTSLSQATGGLVLDAVRTDDLGRAFEQIARELACQYSIGYYPSNQKHNRKFRGISVKMKQPGLVARTRPGYVF